MYLFQWYECIICLTLTVWTCWNNNVNIAKAVIEKKSNKTAVFSPSLKIAQSQQIRDVTKGEYDRFL